ncbi:MAG TPA: spherulation-specific family 4 protein [Solirubrobacteraceae bacterium]|nr:spherulation-specific family 4 protein [Solirubrobacteraceae bacterium]
MRKLILILAAALIVAVPAYAQRGHERPSRPVPVKTSPPPVTPPVPPPVVSSSPLLLVPAYFEPDEGWAGMCGEMPVGSTAIVNPDNGPTAVKLAAYAEAITSCQAQGQRIIGYVYTEYGERSLSTVEAQISDYYAWYPSINGVFLDEMADTPDTAYYAALESFIHAKGGTVVGNPGDTASTDWQLGVVDQVVAFEGTAASFAHYTPAPWMLAATPSQIAIIVYSASSSTACSTAAVDNAGSVYFTNLGEPNPYGALPSFWTSLTSAC